MKTTILIFTMFFCTILHLFGQWTYTNLSAAKCQMGSATLGNKAYFAGGTSNTNFLNKVEIYDFDTKTWDYATLSVSRQFPAGVSCGSKVFFAGGIRFYGDGTVEEYDVVDIYDTATKTWTVEHLSQKRFAVAPVVYDNKVYFAGGVNLSTGSMTKTIDIYDLETGEWSIAELPEARAGMGVAVAGHVAFFAGGWDFVNVSDQVDMYDFVSGTWSTLSLSQARLMIAATTNGKTVMFAGGMTDPSDSLSASDRVDMYNVLTNEWSTGTLSKPRAFFSEYGATVDSKSFFVCGGEFYGDQSYWTKSFNIVDIYDAANGTWSVDSVTQDIINESVIACGNHLLVAGGYSLTTGNLCSRVEIYTTPSLIHVPADYPTIQQGIAAAGPGDTVLVADGLYYENINFLGKKPLMVASEFLMDGDTNHINSTIIDGSQFIYPDSASVVTLRSGEDTTSVLCGFTITGGIGTIIEGTNYETGGGVFIEYSGAKLLDNHIAYNEVRNGSWASGGGVSAGGPVTTLPWVVLRGNRISHNNAISTVDAGSGGGVLIYYNLIMENNEISNNVANGYLGGDGAGAAIGGNFGPIEVNVHNNEITNNEAVTSVGTNNYATLGGGISFYWDVTGNVSNNLISNNSLKAPSTYWSFGVGVFVQDITSKDFIFENNLIEDNIATTEKCFGGGLSLLRSVGTYQNNVLINNTASHGGGFSAEKEDKEIGMPALISNTNPGEGFNTKNGEKDGDIPILFNNTITGNEANNGNGIYLQSVANAFVMNSIIWGNFPPGGDNIKLVNSNIEVRYCDVELIDGGIWPGEGNIDEEPQFQSDGYHLDYPSTLLNMGVSSIVINEITYQAPLYDIDGEVRPFASTQPDIGADEAQWSYVSVNESALSSSLIKIYPNPVRDQLHIDFELDKEATVIIELYNTTGNLVQTVNQTNSAGKNHLKLNTANLQPGLYFIRLKAGNLIATSKVVKL